MRRIIVCRVDILLPEEEGNRKKVKKSRIMQKVKQIFTIDRHWKEFVFFFFQDCFSNPRHLAGIVSEVEDNLVFRMAQNLYNWNVKVINI
jgi:hypothetical protein